MCMTLEIICFKNNNSLFWGTKELRSAKVTEDRATAFSQELSSWKWNLSFYTSSIFSQNRICRGFFGYILAWVFCCFYKKRFFYSLLMIKTTQSERQVAMRQTELGPSQSQISMLLPTTYMTKEMTSLLPEWPHSHRMTYKSLPGRLCVLKDS
jgi:hypothetical protein